MDSVKKKCKDLFDYVTNIISMVLITYIKGYATRYKRKTGKKLVCGFGRCHMPIYRFYMNQSKTFSEKYHFLRMPGMNGKKLYFVYSKVLNSKKFWENIDVFIYNYGYLDNPLMPKFETVLAMLSDEVEKIPVSHIAFKGYFPQHTRNVFKNDKMFTWGDKNLNKLLETGFSEESIREILNENYYDEKYVLKQYSKALESLKDYEKNCEVVMADYIEKYGKTDVLYYSMTHPVGYMMKEAAMRLLERFGIDRAEIENVDIRKAPQILTNGEIVYPSVGRWLGIDKEKYVQRIIRPGKRDEFNVEAYVREYLRQGQAAKECN